MLFYRSNSDIVNLIMFFFEHFIFGELISLINKDLIEPVLNRVKSMLKQLCDSDDYLDYVTIGHISFSNAYQSAN